MRSPVIAFGIFAAAAVSPTLVSAAPTSPSIGTGITPPAGVPNPATAANHVGNPLRAAPAPIPTPPHVPRELSDHHDRNRQSHRTKHERRVNDGYTSGGNAYSGVSGDVSGGDTVNNSNEESEITNNNSSMFFDITLILLSKRIHNQTLVALAATLPVVMQSVVTVTVSDPGATGTVVLLVIRMAEQSPTRALTISRI
jgi:hypothetical protein